MVRPAGRSPKPRPLDALERPTLCDLLGPGTGPGRRPPGEGCCSGLPLPATVLLLVALSLSLCVLLGLSLALLGGTRPPESDSAGAGLAPPVGGGGAVAQALRP